MKHNSPLLQMLTCALFFVLITAIFPFIEDPVYQENTFRPGDNRENRLGSLSYKQLQIIENNLLTMAQSDNQEKRFDAISKLIAFYRQRNMITDALHWLKIGRNEFPENKLIQKETAEIKRIYLRNMNHD